MVNSCVNFRNVSLGDLDPNPTPSGSLFWLHPATGCRYIQTKMAEYAEELWELMQVPRDALEDVFPP